MRAWQERYNAIRRPVAATFDNNEERFAQAALLWMYPLFRDPASEWHG
jgi:hypothetical protein